MPGPFKGSKGLRGLCLSGRISHSASISMTSAALIAAGAADRPGPAVGRVLTAKNFDSFIFRNALWRGARGGASARARARRGIWIYRSYADSATGTHSCATVNGGRFAVFAWSGDRVARRCSRRADRTHAERIVRFVPGQLAGKPVLIAADVRAYICREPAQIRRRPVVPRRASWARRLHMLESSRASDIVRTTCR
jgi:hypothetical protein